jgi:hypothetical protein
MRAPIRALLLCLIFLSCNKKKKEAETVTPEPETGDVTVVVEPTDSLGDLFPLPGGFAVKLSPSMSATTDANGKAIFQNVQYGDYLPNIVKPDWDPGVVELHHASANTVSVIPVAQRSPFRVQNLAGNAVKKDSITISFTLDKPVPAGKSVKVAVITSTNSALNDQNYETFDIQQFNSSTVNAFNVGKLPKLSSWLSKLDSGAFVYLKTVSVSYGEYATNILSHPLLLGENSFLSENFIFKKNWK